MQVVNLGFRFHQVVTADKTGRQADAAAGLDHQHRQVAAGAHPLLEGPACGPGRTDVSLGVLDPVLDDLNQLLQEHQGPLIAAHQRLLGHVHRGWIVLSIGQPALQAAGQIPVEVAHWVGQQRFVALQAGLQQGRRFGFHQAAGLHAEGFAGSVEAGPDDFIAASCHQGVLASGLGADRQLEIQQPLEPLPPGFEAEAVGAKQHGCAVAVGEGVDYAGTHAESAMK